MQPSGRENRSDITLHCSKTEARTKTMFSSVMRAFDRASLTIFIALAMTPMLAIAVAASIR
jgi:hypothetical protein